ncbi:hypothetical protein JCM10296v2_004243 [Rhodotorula toruloides]
MQIKRILPTLPLLFAGAAAQIISIPGLDASLLQGGSLLNLNAFANILGGGSCPGATVGVRASVLGLVKVCACLNVLQLGSTDQACPTCTANASPICGGPGTCACACNDGYYATETGICAPNSGCAPPNTLTDLGTYSVCTCAPGYLPDGAGGCILTPSGRARSRHRRQFGTLPHRRSQDVFGPKSSERLVQGDASLSCPDGETACPLPSGGFECVDTTNSLTSCGGCVGSGYTGKNCLAIPGALSVQCADSQCHVGSCFRGWRYSKDGFGACV